MKFLFTAPRFHTNQVPIVKGLIEKGHEVRYFVVFVGATEDHTYCEPLVLKPSKMTIREKKHLVRTKNESEVESAIGGHFIPDFSFLKQAFEAYMPDVVICREKTNLTLCVKALCDQYNVPCILYDQKPVYRLKAEARSSPLRLGRKPIWERVLLKLDKTVNPGQIMLQKMRSSSGFPTVHMTPVKYARLPRELSEGTPEPGAFFVPFVAEPHPEAKNRAYQKDGILRILCVGKYRDYKNVKLLIEAAALLGEDLSWHLTVVGQAVSADEAQYFEEVKCRVSDLGLASKITLIRNIPHDQISRYYLENDLFVLPTKREHASIAVLEAMSYGLAVISTDYNGTASYVEDAGCGTVFQTENAEDLTEKIQLIRSEDLKRMGKNAFQSSIQFLTFDSYYGELCRLLEREFCIQ